MRGAIRPSLHFFVCANRREGSPLGPGCGDHGEAVFAAMKNAIGADVRRTWVTKTHCLGICPKRGATVARYGDELAPVVVTDVTPADVPELFRARTCRPSLPALLGDLHDLQRGKVLDLARRLKPGLTLEDVQNPHDFPELDDPDWHYADGVLAGIASVRTALAAREQDDHGQEEDHEGT